MTRVIKVERMSCDHCGTVIDSYHNNDDGDKSFYTLHTDIYGTKAAISLNSIDDSDWVGVERSVEVDLCPSCYKVAHTVLERGLNNKTGNLRN